MNKVSWGIIGCGDVTEVKSGPAFSKVENSELYAVMRRNEEKAKDYAHRHGVPKWYTDADKLINDPQVNAIYVATPPDTHAFYAKKAIEAGKPVYIEKPMGLTFSECEEVNKLASSKKVPVFVAYYRRKLPGFIKLKNLIEEKAIGDIRMVNIQLFKNEKLNDELPWRVDPTIAGGGYFFDLASHQIDLLMYFFGDFKEVNSIVDNQGGRYDAEDILSVSFQFENGIIGNGVWCFNSSEINNKDVIEIVGTKGRIEFSTFDFVPLKLYTEKETISFDFQTPQHVQYNLIEEVVSSIAENKLSVSTGVSGAKTNMILDKIVAKYYSVK